VKRCRIRKTHWEQHGAAARALRSIQDNPRPTADGTIRLYSPTAVVSCHCGGYVLTSSECKTYAKGKQGRGRRATGRRR
jgi:hypothetical protein